MKNIAIQKLQSIQKTRRSQAICQNDIFLVSESEDYAIYSSPLFGYAIISKDNQCPPIIGYSDKPFPKEVPTDMKWLLKEFSVQKNNYLQSFISLPENVVSKVEALVPCKWGQSEPYNWYTPTYISQGKTLHYPTGCLATAMSQLMYFYKSPTRGTGGSAYYVDGKTLPVIVDFSQTIYNWDKMLPSYLEYYDEDQASAVATLMYHCGASVEMTYDQSGSGAYSYMGCSSLRKKFGYGASYFYLRQFVNQQEWMKMIYTSLSNGRPIIYGGIDDKNGGHAFILDGYDQDGLVSVNWGWSGDGDGYFDIALLNVGKYSFKNGQEMIIIDGPQTEMVKKSSWGIGYNMVAEKSTSDRILISCDGIYNLDPEPFSGLFGIIAEKEGEKSVLHSEEWGDSKNPIQFGNGYRIKDVEVSVSAIPNGRYVVYMATKGVEETDWQQIRSNETVINYIFLEKTESGITISTEDSPTRVHDVMSDSKMNPIYFFDLQGREVGPATKGLLIRKQGNEVKKVIVK